MAGVVLLMAGITGKVLGRDARTVECGKRFCLSQAELSTTAATGEQNLTKYTDEQIRNLAKMLNVPDYIAVTGIELGSPYYWEGAGIYLQNASLFSNSVYLASADVSPDTLEPLKSLLSYDSESVDQSKIARYTEFADTREIVRDLAFLINRPYWEAEAIFPDLVLVEGQKGGNHPCKYSNGYVGFEAAGGSVKDSIQRVIVYGRDSIYTIYGYKPGDPWDAPRAKGFDEGGTSEYFDSYGNILIMYYSMADTDPNFDGKPYIEYRSYNIVM